MRTYTVLAQKEGRKLYSGDMKGGPQKKFNKLEKTKALAAER